MHNLFLVSVRWLATTATVATVVTGTISQNATYNHHSRIKCSWFQSAISVSVTVFHLFFCRFSHLLHTNNYNRIPCDMFVRVLLCCCKENISEAERRQSAMVVCVFKYGFESKCICSTREITKNKRNGAPQWNANIWKSPIKKFRKPKEWEDDENRDKM